MSTPEDGLPAEARLAGHSPANFASAPPTGYTPTPGVSAGVTRVPTSPTLPEPDPVSLTTLLSRMANELYSAPPAPAPATVGASGSAIDTAPASHPAAAPGYAPAVTPPAAPAGAPAVASTTSAPAAPSRAPAEPSAPRAPSQGGNPFLVEPRFEGIFSGHELPAFAHEEHRLPLFESNPDASAPYFVPTAAPAASRARPAPTQPSHQHPSAPSQPRAPAHEIDVTPALELRLPAQGGGFDAHALRKEFPILEERVHGKRLVWLDNAATTQKPRAVIERIKHFYEHENSNIHRAAHALAARATDAYEGARESVGRFVNAPSAQNVIFVRGATEGINLVAQSWGRRNIQSGDEIVVTWLEHHANIVPWQMLCAEKGARLRVAPVDSRGQIILEEYERLLGPKTRLVSLPQVSNALGTVTPAKAMVDMAHRHGARVLVDGAQSVSHMRVDVQALDCDFFVFSGHKIFAPTGIGVVYGKGDVLDATPPWQGGGNMIQDVTFERTVYQPPPARFEAGTGNIADAVGLGAALDWLTRVGLENVSRHEHDLLEYATARTREVPGLTIIGTAAEKAGVLSFVLEGHSTQEVSTYLDREGIAVRGGHHCAQPILRRFGLESTVRASLAPYNVSEDIDALINALRKLQGA